MAFLITLHAIIEETWHNSQTEGAGIFAIYVFVALPQHDSSPKTVAPKILALSSVNNLSTYRVAAKPRKNDKLRYTIKNKEAYARITKGDGRRAFIL